MITKELTVANPKLFAQCLVACLGADKGIRAYLANVYNDVPGTVAVWAEGIHVTLRPHFPQPCVEDVVEELAPSSSPVFNFSWKDYV